MSGESFSERIDFACSSKTWSSATGGASIHSTWLEAHGFGGFSIGRTTEQNTESIAVRKRENAHASVGALNDLLHLARMHKRPNQVDAEWTARPEETAWRAEPDLDDLIASLHGADAETAR